MNKPICVFQAPIWTRSGYGDWALSIAKSLLKYDKFDLRIIPTRWGNCSKKNLNEEFQDPLGAQLLSRILKNPLHAQPELFIHVTIPNEFLMTQQGIMKIGKFNIGMTASIETTLPKPEWLEGLNRMDLNIVMSKHGKDVFDSTQYSKKLPNGTVEALKVTSPLEILFWGADTSIYNKDTSPVQSVNQELQHIKEDFAFLFVGQWTGGNMNSDRKAIGWLIKTFLETFKSANDPKPCLILKTNGPTLSKIDKHECISKINEITQLVKSENPSINHWPNIYLLHGELSDVEMNALFNHDKVKAHISFTHGEGFGHPLLLATLSGKPLLAPKWSGHLDYLNPEYANLLEGRLEKIPTEAINEWFSADAQWFSVNYDAAKEQIKKIYYQYESFLPNAEKLRLENVAKFSVSAMDLKFHYLLDKYVPKFAVANTLQLPKLKKLDLSSPKP